MLKHFIGKASVAPGLSQGQQDKMNKRAFAT